MTRTCRSPVLLKDDAPPQPIGTGGATTLPRIFESSKEH